MPRKLNYIPGEKYGPNGLLLLQRSDKKDKNGKAKWGWYQCPDCGQPFEAYMVSAAIEQDIWHCGCLTPKSKGEDKIQGILQELQIDFKREYSFDKCKNPCTGTILRFDFYLPTFNACIEYDGIQHFQETSWTHSSLQDINFRDSVKDNYCSANKIRMVRIPYWDFDILSEKYILDKLKNIN